MINTRISIFKSLKKLFKELIKHADTNPIGFKDIMYAVILNDMREWALYKGEKIIDKFDRILQDYILSHKDFKIERILGDSKIYKNVNTPQDNTTWSIISDIMDKSYVDLGLPSGTLWATCNIGAEKPEEVGHYLSWGEIESYHYNQVYSGKRLFNWSEYKWGNYNSEAEDEGLTKYTKSDLKLLLDLEDDIIYNTTNGKFKLPTVDQIDELFRDTNAEWTTYNNVQGYKFTHKLNPFIYIFIPASGDCVNGVFDYYNQFCFIWTNHVCDEKESRREAYCGCFSDGNYDIRAENRCKGINARGVLNKN